MSDIYVAGLRAHERGPGCGVQGGDHARPRLDVEEEPLHPGAGASVADTRQSKK